MSGKDGHMSGGNAQARLQAAIDRRVASGAEAGIQAVAAYGDIDTGVAVAVMRSRFDADLATVSEIDRIVAEVCSPRATT
jgi:hypothetical protein